MRTGPGGLRNEVCINCGQIFIVFKNMVDGYKKHKQWRCLVCLKLHEDRLFAMNSIYGKKKKRSV